MDENDLKNELKAITRSFHKLTKRLETLVDDLSDFRPTRVVIRRAGESGLAAAVQGGDGAGKVRKRRKETTPELIFGIIERSVDGIDVDGLIGKTGFNKAKIANSIFRLKKAGRIRSPKRGFYVKA